MENPFPISVTSIDPKHATRFLSRLVSSIPGRAEEALSSLLDPIGLYEDGKATVNSIKDSYKKGNLAQDSKRILVDHMRSPEALADLSLDVLSTAVTRKLPMFKTTNLDEYALAGLAAHNLPGQEKKIPYVPGAQIMSTLDRVNQRFKDQSASISAQQQQENINRRTAGLPPKPSRFDNPFNQPARIKK